MKHILSILSLLALLSLTGCDILDPRSSGSSGGSSDGGTSGNAGGGSGQSFDELHVSSTTGVVVQITLEANDIFWGLLSDDGRKFEVLNLPMNFRTDGLRVRFEGDIWFVATRSSGYGATLGLSKIEQI